jgi:hypothetical protein
VDCRELDTTTEHQTDLDTSIDNKTMTTTTQPSKTVASPSEARIWAVLESETPIQQVTYDEANESAEGLSNQQPGSAFEDESISVKEDEVIESKYNWLIVIFIILVLVASLGLMFGLKAKDTPPAPTSKPTLRPVAQFVGVLPEYTLEIAETDEGSPQAKAFMWLRSDSYDEPYRINQRYALAVLYFSTNGGSWTFASGWMSNTSECTWYMNSIDEICDESSRLVTLSRLQTSLDGSFPKELELLTHLRTLELVGSSLTGSIYTEMYVP